MNWKRIDKSDLDYMSRHGGIEQYIIIKREFAEPYDYLILSYPDGEFVNEWSVGCIHFSKV